MKEYHKIQSVYLRDPANKNKTFLMGQFSTPEFEYLQNNTWIYTEKVDGCLHYGSLIMTDQGRVPIGRIVNDRMDLRILSYNTSTGMIEYKGIEHYHKEERLRPFVSVTVASRNKGNRPKHIVCTDNHKFYTETGWIEAKNLVEGQLVKHITAGMSREVQQVILGTLLGDGSIYRPSERTRGFSFNHSVAQAGYFDFKKMLLGDLFHECKGFRGGYEGSQENRRGNSIVNAAISDLIMKYCERDGKKSVNKLWLDELDPLGIAIWYMDDGSVDFNDKQRPRIRFSTQNFSMLEARVAQNMFCERFGVDSEIADYSGPTLCLTADGTERLFSLIFPYICESMKYKLPERYRSVRCVLDAPLEVHPALVDTQVLSVSELLPKRARAQQGFQYDLTIEDNSNYFTNSILVHNTNIRVMWDGEKITFSGKTDTSQIPNKLVNWLVDRFIGKEEQFKEIFKDATQVCLYSEGYGHGIQKAGKDYRADQSITLFDVKIHEWWLERHNVEDIALKLGLDVVPIIGKGSLAGMVEITKNGFKSQWGDFVAEGIVAWPEAYLFTRGGERIITKVKHKDFTRMKDG
jgi:hypothetical protein